MHTPIILASAVLAARLAWAQTADLPIYAPNANAVASGWENWSWGTDFNWAFTGPTPAVPSSLGTAVWANSTAYGAASFKLSTGDITAYKTLVFQAAGDNPQVGVSLSSVSDNASADVGTLKTDCVAPVTTDKFVQCYADLSKVEAHPYNRVTFQSQSGGSQVFLLGNVYLTTKTALELTDSHTFSTGAFLGSQTLMMVGTGNATQVKVTKKGVSKPLAVWQYYSTIDPVARTYIHFRDVLGSGTYTVSHDNKTFDIVLPSAVKAKLSSAKGTVKINKDIYGVNFPASAGYLQAAGIPLSRWGGNAMTTYNPDGDYINSAADWFFENRLADQGGLFGWLDSIVVPGGSKAIALVPVIDWVSKNISCASYSVKKYGAQQSVDQWNTDAGNGLLVSNGSRIINDPNDCYVPWTPDSAAKWLKSWPKSRFQQVSYLSLDNELDITDGTHVDIHPNKMTYDEELDRLWRWGSAIRKAVGNDVKIIGPSSCCFWFWWHSSAGDADMAAHNGTGKLRWLLRSLNAKYKATKIKTLDVLDLHFNPEEGRTGNGTDVDNASRLRATRAWWDYTYADESYMGQTSVWPASEPKKGAVAFIPRFKQMIKDEYPGLGLGASEWYSHQDLVGGLQVADTLGIFGREGLTFATKWSGVDPGSAGAAAYWLYLGGINSTTPYPSDYLPIPIFYDPNVAGVYIAKDGNKVGAVFVNKDPKNYQRYAVSGLTDGKYTVRHFGWPMPGAAESARLETLVTIQSSGIIIPPYSAVFIHHQSGKSYKDLPGTVTIKS